MNNVISVICRFTSPAQCKQMNGMHACRGPDSLGRCPPDRRECEVVSIVKPKLIWLAAVSLLGSILLVACHPVATTEKPLVWTGRILEIQDDRSFLAAVDAPDQPALGDKAHVSLYQDAVVRDAAGKTIRLDAIPAGGRVRVAITGGIRESYPVQVSAIRVDWLDSPVSGGSIPQGNSP